MTFKIIGALVVFVATYFITVGMWSGMDFVATDWLGWAEPNSCRPDQISTGAFILGLWFAHDFWRDF